MSTRSGPARWRAPIAFNEQVAAGAATLPDVAIFDKLRTYLANIGRGGDADTAVQQQNLLEEFSRLDKERIDRYKLYEEHYDGDHQVPLDDRTQEYLEHHSVPWSENFCETILDALANRLKITNWASDNAQLVEWANGFWKADRQAEAAGTVHLQTPMKGDGYLAVGWDPESGAPGLYWNDPSCCRPIYDAEGRLVGLVKVWNSGDVTPTNPTGKWIQRMNLYLPDRIEKWFTLAGTGTRNWSMHLDPDDTVWPTPWVRRDGTPRGVGVIHFRHKAKGRMYGRSHLRNVLPQQAMLNKQVIDLAQILDYQAWRQRWATGISPDEIDKLEGGPGSLLWSASDKAKFGDFAADDPAGALAAIEATTKRMGARSGTPLHLIGGTGELPSGESLKTALEPMVIQVQDAQPTYGGPWSRVMDLAAGLEADYGTTGLQYTGDDAITAIWNDPTPRNAKAEAETAEIQGRIGVSRKTLITNLGYDADEEERQLEEQSESDAARRERQFAAGTGA